MVREYTLYYFYHFKVIEVCFREEQTKPKGSRRKEIIKMRVEISEIENRKTKEKIKDKSCFFEIDNIDKILMRCTKKTEKSLRLLKSGMRMEKLLPILQI